MSFFKKIFGKKKQEPLHQEEMLQEEQSLQETNEGASNAESVTEETVEQERSVIEDAEEDKIEEIQELLEDAKEDKTEEAQDLLEKAEETQELLEDVKEDKTEETQDLLEDAQQEEPLESTEVSDSMYDTSLEEVEETQEVEPAEELEEVEEVAPAPVKTGFIKRLFSGLTKTRDSILKGVDEVLSQFKHIDEELYEELEEALIMADFGVDTTLFIMDKLRAKVKQDKITDPAQLKGALQQIITDILTDQPVQDILNPQGPTVILVIGVNGAGKTTSIGKMAHLFKTHHKKVIVAAADTFRAAAIEQLNVWTERAGVDIIKHEEGSDAAAVVFDGIAAAKSRKSDVLICDTAGRLQNKTNLMKELEKISRIIAREYPEAKKEILIVLDATTGQNAIQQVKLFKEVAAISGIILTKLDGTAKGGAIVGIYESLKVPVKYVGVGEKIDDLQPFDAEAFAKALFENEA